jgi:hypothetical protein
MSGAMAPGSGVWGEHPVPVPALGSLVALVSVRAVCCTLHVAVAVEACTAHVGSSEEAEAADIGCTR